MNKLEPEGYRNKNFRRHSFRGENLCNADFSGADIRGCDFSYCNLASANFTRTLIGKTPQDILAVTFVSLIVAIATFQAISQMVFGVIGRTPDDSLWNYTLVLFISLGIAAIATAVRYLLEYRHIATILSGAASGAILGFYYGGVMTNNNPQVAATSAAIAAIIMAIFSYFGSGLMVIGIAIAGCIATYGLTFAVGFWTITYLSVQSLIGSIILGILTLIMMAIALFNLQLAYKEITHFGITSFRGADLTNTNFQDAKIHHANTSGAIGFKVKQK